MVRNTETSTQDPSDGVVDLEVVPGEAEPLGEVSGERLDAEALGRVVSCSNEPDPGLAGNVNVLLGAGIFGRLAEYVSATPA